MSGRRCGVVRSAPGRVKPLWPQGARQRSPSDPLFPSPAPPHFPPPLRPHLRQRQACGQEAVPVEVTEAEECPVGVGGWPRV